MKKITFKVNDAVQIYEDVLTQHKFEGVGRIVKIHKHDKKTVDCDVRFYVNPWGNTADLEKEVVRRQIKR